MDGNQVVDEHWQRQARFCGGLENTLQYYDTVELLEFNTAHDKVSKMLHAAGIPYPINATLPVFGTSKFFPPPQPNQAPLSGHPGHTTNAAAAEQSYYTSNSLSNAVMSHYMEDYLLFGIRAPQWAVQSLEHRPPVAEREKNINERRRR